MANETLDFALLAWREDGTWQVSRLPDDALTDIGIVLDALRAQQVDGGALAMMAIDDSFFIAIRQVGERMQMVLSDVMTALDYEIAAEVLELTDYKVRILEGRLGTGAITRVLVETSDGKGEWNTVGVHENVIAASAMALEDAVTFGLLRQGRKPE